MKYIQRLEKTKKKQKKKKKKKKKKKNKKKVQQTQKGEFLYCIALRGERRSLKKKGVQLT